MTSAVRAWRYLLPDVDVDADAATGTTGLQLSATGAIDLVSGDAAVRQALLLLVLTTPGERVMRPTYGCYLRRLLYAPNDDTTAGLAIHYIRSAIQRWEPRVEVLRLDAERHAGDPTRLQVVLEYRVRATKRTDELVFVYALESEATP